MPTFDLQQLRAIINCTTCPNGLVCARRGIDALMKKPKGIEDDCYACLRCKTSDSYQCESSLVYDGTFFCRCIERSKIIACFV